ncbi:MAG TPA: dephospho-CoA kinase [Polyangia bacterium]
MSRARRGGLRVVGLTGGIGSGKSTVAGMFAARGIPVIDADALAREVVAPGGSAHAEVAAAWPEVIGPEGAVDRKRLGKIVFDDPAARKKLEGFTHPRIQAAGDARLAGLGDAGERLALYEATLLVESGRWRDFDGLIVVVASPERQLARAMTRDGLTRAEAEARLKAQGSTEERLRVATEVIDNDGALAGTEAQVEVLLAKLR